MSSLKHETIYYGINYVCCLSMTENESKLNSQTKEYEKRLSSTFHV